MLSKRIIDFLSGGIRTHFHVLWVCMIVMLFVPSVRHQVFDGLVYIASVIYAGFYISRLVAKSKGEFNLWNLFKSVVNAVIIFLVLFRQDEAQSIAIILFSATYLIDRWLLNSLLMKWQLVLNLIAVLVSIFFVVYAQIQTKLADELSRQVYDLQKQQFEYMDQVQKEAANTRAAQAEVTFLRSQLEECQTREE